MMRKLPRTGKGTSLEEIIGIHTKRRTYKMHTAARGNLNIAAHMLKSSDFSRQLWYYVFGMHNLGSKEATMYTYTERQGEKGVSDVVSLLHNYFNKNLQKCNACQ